MAISIQRAILNKHLSYAVKGVKGKILNLGSKDKRYSNLFVDSTVINNDLFSKGADLGFDANERFPLPDSSYDCVFAMNILEHLFEPQNMLNESHRVLKKGGCLIFNALFIFQYHRDPYDCFRFARDGVEYMLKKAKFKHYEITEVGGRYSVLAEQFRNFIPFLPWVWMVPLLTYMDDTLLSKSEKEIGKRWHFGYFVKAYKV